MTPEKTVERLSLYRRIVEKLLSGGKTAVFSHELASLAGVTSSQVRRDFMFIGTNGRANTGYVLNELLVDIEKFLISHQPDSVALVGIGNLGRAVLSFFIDRRPNLKVKAAFDVDSDKTGRVIHGCKCYSIDMIEKVIPQQDINVAIIAVPSSEAQQIVDSLVTAGVTGIMNFAPVALNVPDGVFVDNVDLTMALEKVAHFARKK